MANITLVGGPEEKRGQKIRLENREMVLGRHPDCDIVLDSGSVSRQHAKISFRDGRYLLQDMGSRNGTYLNSEWLHKPALLKDGDAIRICDLEFTFHETQELTVPRSAGTLPSSKVEVEMVDDPLQSGSRSILGKREDVGSGYGTASKVPAQQQLSAMVAISRALDGAVSQEVVLPKVLDGLFEIFTQADRGYVLLLDEEGELIPRWIKDRKEGQDESVHQISRSVLQYAIEKKEALLVFDAAKDERFKDSQSILDFSIRSAIIAPIVLSNSTPIGAIQLDSQKKARFEERDLEMLMAVSGQVRIAFENARMVEQLLLQKVLEQDLSLARQVQSAFLPQKPPGIDRFEFSQFYQPQLDIGGDYFDYIQLSQGQWAILVADVVGHGIAAAMFMAKLSAETRFAFASSNDPVVAMESLNRRICALGLDNTVTMCAIFLDPARGSAIVVNAGHMPPLLKRADGSIEEPGQEESGWPLGTEEEASYQGARIDLKPGDFLLMYTDGVFEAFGEDNTQFSIERVRKMVSEHQGNLDGLMESIIQSVVAHIGSGKQEDDMCMVAIGCR